MRITEYIYLRHTYNSSLIERYIIRHIVSRRLCWWHKFTWVIIILRIMKTIELTCHSHAPPPRFKLNLRVLSESRSEGIRSRTTLPFDVVNKDESNVCSFLRLIAEKATTAHQKTMDSFDKEVSPPEAICLVQLRWGSTFIVPLWIICIVVCLSSSGCQGFPLTLTGTSSWFWNLFKPFRRFASAQRKTLTSPATKRADGTWEKKSKKRTRCRQPKDLRSSFRWRQAHLFFLFVKILRIMTVTIKILYAKRIWPRWRHPHF